MAKKLIYFTNAMDELYRKACKKAQKEILRFGYSTEPLRLTFEKDDLCKDYLGCNMSIYVLNDNRVLLRRYWEKENSIKYNEITNYEEIIEMAPNSIMHMKKNAIKSLKA